MTQLTVGSAAVSITTANAQADLLGQNSGSSTIYLSELPDVSATVNSLALAPGTPFTWPKGKQLYGICAEGETSTLTYETNGATIGVTTVSIRSDSVVLFENPAVNLPIGTTQVYEGLLTAYSTIQIIVGVDYPSGALDLTLCTVIANFKDTGDTVTLSANSCVTTSNGKVVWTLPVYSPYVEVYLAPTVAQNYAIKILATTENLERSYSHMYRTPGGLGYAIVGMWTPVTTVNITNFERYSTMAGTTTATQAVDLYPPTASGQWHYYTQGNVAHWFVPRILETGVAPPLLSGSLTSTATIIIPETPLYLMHAASANAGGASSYMLTKL